MALNKTEQELLTYFRILDSEEQQREIGRLEGKTSYNTRKFQVITGGKLSDKTGKRRKM